MKIVPLGPIKETEGKNQVFKVPEGAVDLLFNPKSMEIHFKTMDEPAARVPLQPEEDYQFFSERTGKWVKVNFKKDDKPFKGVRKCQDE